MLYSWATPGGVARTVSSGQKARPAWPPTDDGGTLYLVNAITRTSERAESLLNVTTIYHEPEVVDYGRGRAILERFPDAERIEVPSHWNIPALHRNEELADDWVRVKRTTLVLGVKKGLQIRPNERSADFIAPSTASGCALACPYCYVGRRKGFANPISTFVNIEQIAAAIARHAGKQGWKLEPTAADASLWVYEIGTNSDVSVDALIGENVRDLVALFRDLPNARATFATKFVNRHLLDYDPQGKSRIRFSLMPQTIARTLDVRTSPVAERIAAIDDFLRAGYEVNVNIAPVVMYDGWLDDYGELFDQLADGISRQAREQLVAEVIFLTHDAQLHEVNQRWHPQAEALLWRPELQEEKVAQISGDRVLRYKLGLKQPAVRQLCALLRAKVPGCAIRYAF